MYKKTVIGIILLLTLIALPLSSQSQGQAIITGENINVRKGPGLSFEVLIQVQKGKSYPIIGEQGDWYQIKLGGGKTGWVANWLVTKKETTESVSIKSGIITADSLRVRSGPGTSYEVMGSLNKGEQVKIYTEKAGWSEISFNNDRGWVSNDYVEGKTKNDSVSSKSTSDLSGILGTVTATSLNVREIGSFNGKVIGKISQGDTFKILEEANNWVKIEFNSGETGWVASWYLEKSIPQEASSSNKTVKNSSVTILHNGTNIRSHPDLNSKVVERANSGDSYSIINIHNDWYEVKLSNGNSGYVAGWIVSVSSGVPQVVKTGNYSGLRNKTIMIDPGHGGNDNGATGAKGTIEKKLTLKTGEMLYKKLMDKGANVLLTRTGDQYVSLGKRVSMANHQDIDAFISIHYDSIEDRTVRGMTSFYYHSYQKELASAVHKSTNAQTRLKDRGVRLGDYHVIRENKEYAILLELGYISNPTEELLLNTDHYQEQVANGIVKGLAGYFSNN